MSGPNAAVNQDGKQTPTTAEESSHHEEFLNFFVVHNRQKYPFSLPPSTTIHELKKLVEPLTQVPIAMQKLIYRGMLSDEACLKSLNLPVRDAKIMLVGATQSEADQIRQVEAKSVVLGDTALDNMGEQELAWCEQTEHKRILERFGKPENAMIGIMNSEEMLAPDEPLTGMYDKRGQALRLRIRPDTCELWLATKDITQKVPLITIQDVISQPIKDHPEYHIMAFQLGPTPKSRFFVYWLPSQYVESIKTMVLQHHVLDPGNNPRL